MLSIHEFAALTPALSAQRRADILPPLQAAMERFDITSRLRECHFLAQLLHESGRFRFKEEIASGEAYEGRADLGNTHPGDGRKYKGRGWIQVTGRHNYRKYGALLGLPLEAQPALAATDTNAALIAAAYWSDHGLNALADRDDLLTITRRINGGTNGIADRRECLALCKRVLNADAEQRPIEVYVLGKFVGAEPYQDRTGAVWVRLRPVVDALPDWSIKSAREPRAILQSRGVEVPVPLEIRDGVGYSPVGPLCEVTGYRKSWDGAKREVRITERV